MPTCIAANASKRCSISLPDKIAIGDPRGGPMARQVRPTPRPGPLVWAASLVLLTLAEAGHRTAASGFEAMGPAKRDSDPKPADGGKDRKDGADRKDGKNAVKPTGA